MSTDSTPHSRLESEKALLLGLNALRLEVPSPVWEDIYERATAYVKEANELVEQLEARDRWAAFTHRETQDMHHALRMFAKYPGLSDEEAAGYTALADEIWDRHAAQTAAAYPARERS